MAILLFFIFCLVIVPATSFRRSSSLLQGRRKLTVFESPGTQPFSETTQVEEISTEVIKTKKRSSADQVENLAQKKKQTEIWRFLKREINMSDRQSKTIHELYPWLFDIDYENQIKPVMEIFRSYDFQNKVIRLIVKENPFVFKKSLDDIERRIQYLKDELQFTNIQLIHLFKYQPIVLSLQEQKVVDILTFFKEVVEFSPKQLQKFFTYQFRVWKTPIQDIKDYYGKLRALGYSPEDIQGRLLSNKECQKKFYFQLPRIESYDPRYLTEYLD